VDFQNAGPNGGLNAQTFIAFSLIDLVMGTGKWRLLNPVGFIFLRTAKHRLIIFLRCFEIFS